MAVNLTISKTFGGSQVADSLSGGSVGLDLGQVENSQFVPITNQSANTGHQDIMVRHDATVDPITDVKTYIAEYSGTYGGADSAANDIATLIAQGNADNEATANNSDGNAQGFRIEHAGIDAGTLGASFFLPSRAQVNIYGNNNTDGIDLASAFDLHVDACVYYTTGEADATTPETGKIGISTDSVLGNYAHVAVRYYLNDAATAGGILQWDWTWAYSYTAALLVGISIPLLKLVAGFSIFV